MKSKKKKSSKKDNEKKSKKGKKGKDKDKDKGKDEKVSPKSKNLVPEPVKSPFVKVRRSSIHNRGVFAKRFIPEDTRIIEYVGEKISKTEGIRRAEQILERAEVDHRNGSVYVFELNKKYDIDGSVSWNTARWINHSCEPNCEAQTLKGHIWIIALRDIEKGEELSYNYGYDLDVCEDHPCRCGSPECIGYIVAEEHREALREKLAQD